MIIDDIERELTESEEVEFRKRVIEWYTSSLTSKHCVASYYESPLHPLSLSERLLMRKEKA